jgi:hypothetical protein
VILIQEHTVVASEMDHGRYHPAPSFSKPRFKLIPNRTYCCLACLYCLG